MFGSKPATSTPKDVFQHLLLIVTLYLSVISLIAMSFSYIDILLPDSLDFYYQGALDGIRWSSSMILVVFPIFLGLSWLILREFRQEPGKHEMKIRKWLVYLTLFIASITIIIDLIRLVYNFYSGDLTTKFVLKVLSVLVVTGTVFGYYLWDLKGQSLKSKLPKGFAWGTAAVVLISIVSGFFIVGSPAKQRQIRFDERRVGDLQNIQGSVINYWTQKNTLPVKLEDLNDSISGFMPPLDPESSLAYSYEILTPLSFKLCAEFRLASLDKKYGVKNGMSSPAVDYYKGYYGGPSENWSHEAGRQCFDRTIDPQLYKPVNP
jgi:hypothetical protein